MKRIKVLHVVDGLHPKRGGVPAAVLSISGLMEKIPLSYNILSIGTNPEYETENAIYFTLKKKTSISREALDWFDKNKHNYEIIYFHAVWNITILFMLKYVLKNKISYCISPHGSLDYFDIEKKYLFKKVLGLFLIHKVLINAKYIFCTSGMEKEQLCYFGKKSDNVLVLPLPVDYNIVPTDNAKGFRQKYGLSTGDFVFLFLSRVNYKKGLVELIDSIFQLREKGCFNGKSIKLIIAGDDQNAYGHKLKHKLQSKRLEPIVEFVGLLTGEDKLQAFLGADVFVLPSKNENFGLSIVEALQASLPVLISENVYIHPELFSQNHVPGWLCMSDLSDLNIKMLEALETQDIFTKKNQALKAGNLYRSENLISAYSLYFN